MNLHEVIKSTNIWYFSTLQGNNIEDLDLAYSDDIELLRYNMSTLGSIIYYDTETTVKSNWDTIATPIKEWILAKDIEKYQALRTKLSARDKITSDKFVVAGFYEGQKLIIVDYTMIEYVSFSNRTLVAFNAKFDITVLLKAGVNMEDCKHECLMIADQLIFNDPKIEAHSKHNLLAVCNRFGITRLNSKDKEIQTGFKRDNRLDFIDIIYLIEDILYLNVLREKLVPLIEENKLKKVYNLENRLLLVLAYTEYKGIKFNVEGCKANILMWETTLLQLEKNILNTYLKMELNNGLISLKVKGTSKMSHLINFSSPSQIKEIFSLAKAKYGTTIPLIDKKDEDKKVIEAESTGEQALQNWLTANPHAPDNLRLFCQQLLDYRQTAKLISQYGYGLLTEVREDGNIHTTYGQCFTNTGRLNSMKPNLQNIPQGNEIRNLFLPEDGYLFFDWDFEGQEVYIAADYSKEPLLLNALTQGFDHHSFMASYTYSLIFDKPVTIVNDGNEYLEVVSPLTGKTHKYNMAKELRNTHKNSLFAIFYGGGANRMYGVLSDYINAFWPEEKREEISKKIAYTLKGLLKVLVSWLDDTIQEYNKVGYIVTSAMGRRVRFKPNAYGDVLNSKIQGTGSESVKIAMVLQWDYLRNKEKELGLAKYSLGYIALNVHDQCVVAVKEEHLAKDIIQKKGYITSPLGLELDKLAGDALSMLLSTLKGKAQGKIIDKWEK